MIEKPNQDLQITEKSNNSISSVAKNLGIEKTLWPSFEESIRNTVVEAKLNNSDGKTDWCYLHKNKDGRYELRLNAGQTIPLGYLEQAYNDITRKTEAITKGELLAIKLPNLSKERQNEIRSTLGDKGYFVSQILSNKDGSLSVALSAEPLEIFCEVQGSYCTLHLPGETIGMPMDDMMNPNELLAKVMNAGEESLSAKGWSANDCQKIVLSYDSTNIYLKKYPNNYISLQNNSDEIKLYEVNNPDHPLYNGKIPPTKEYVASIFQKNNDIYAGQNIDKQNNNSEV